MVTTYLRFRDMETRYTRLARRIALDEVRADAPAPRRRADPATPGADGPTHLTR